MSCKCCMVSFDIHLKIFIQTVLTKKTDCSCRIKIILMLHRLLRLGFNIEITRETNFSAVFNSHFHKSCNIFLFKLHVCVKKSFVTFSAAPEYITFAAEFNCKVKRFLNLCSCKTIHISRICTAGTIHETGI